MNYNDYSNNNYDDNIVNNDNDNNNLIFLITLHCLKNVHILSFSGLYFSAFEMNAKIYRVNPVFSPNTGKHGPEKIRIRTLFMQC